MKKISVIIPAYNAERYIERCIQSVLNQTYKNLQIIVINDGSKDNTEKIVKKLSKQDERLELINIINSGVSNARNLGIKYSKGELISFVDADDWLEVDMYEKMVEIMEEKKVPVVRCNNYINYEKNGLEYIASYYDIGNKLLKKDDIEEAFLTNILTRLPCYVVLLLMDVKIAKQLNFDPEIRLLEDKLYYFKLIGIINKMYCLNKPLYHYFINSNSVTNRQDKYEEYIEDMVSVVDKMIIELQKNKMLTDDNNIKIRNIYITVIDRYMFNIYKVYNIDKVKKIYKEIKSNELFSNIKQIYSKKYIKKNKLVYRFTTKYLIKEDYKKLEKMYNIYKYYEPINNAIINLKVFIKNFIEKKEKK